jgi:hypothetical protein
MFNYSISEPTLDLELILTASWPTLDTLPRKTQFVAG